MNIVEMHNRIRQYLDTVNSPRILAEFIDRELNTAISQIVNDRYMPLDPKRRENAFQTTQRIRDELYTLVRPETITASGSTLYFTSLTGYRFLLSCIVTIDGVEYPTTPLTYDEWEIIKDNPHRRPRLTKPALIYRIETSNGLEIKWGRIGTLETGSIYYLKDPNKVSIGTEMTTGALEIGIDYYAMKDSTINNGEGGGSSTILHKGESITPITNLMSLFNGKLTHHVTNCDLPINLHEEVCNLAAQMLITSTKKLIADKGGNN